MQLKPDIIKQTNKNSEFNSYCFRLLHSTTVGLASEDLFNSNSITKILVFLISDLPSIF